MLVAFCAAVLTLALLLVADPRPAGTQFVKQQQALDHVEG
jgi:hypothetical protein